MAGVRTAKVQTPSGQQYPPGFVVGIEDAGGTPYPFDAVTGEWMVQQIYRGAPGDDPNVTIGDPGITHAIFYDETGNVWYWDETATLWEPWSFGGGLFTVIGNGVGSVAQIISSGDVLSVNGSGILTAVSSATDTLTLEVTQEAVQDAVSPMMLNNGFTYDDAGGQWDAAGTAGQVLTADGAGGATWTTPAAGGFTLAGDSGTSGITAGDTLSVLGGTNGIDTVVAADVVTINVDVTELVTNWTDQTTVIPASVRILGDDGNAYPLNIQTSVDSGAVSGPTDVERNGTSSAFRLHFGCGLLGNASAASPIRPRPNDFGAIASTAVFIGGTGIVAGSTPNNTVLVTGVLSITNPSTCFKARPMLTAGGRFGIQPQSAVVTNSAINGQVQLASGTWSNVSGVNENFGGAGLETATIPLMNLISFYPTGAWFTGQSVDGTIPAGGTMTIPMRILIGHSSGFPAAFIEGGFQVGVVLVATP